MSSDILNQYYPVKKRFFNANDRKDRDIAVSFLKTNSWKQVSDIGVCPFILQWPYLNIPSMLKDKLLLYYTTR